MRNGGGSSRTLGQVNRKGGLTPLFFQESALQNRGARARRSRFERSPTQEHLWVI